MLEKVVPFFIFFLLFFSSQVALLQLSDDPPRTRITSVQQVDYSGKANKRTLDAAKARIVAIVALRDFILNRSTVDKNKRKSVNL